MKFWRRGGDSNPRYGFPYARFRGEFFQPLRHLSTANYISIARHGEVFRLERERNATVLLAANREKRLKQGHRFNGKNS